MTELQETLEQVEMDTIGEGLCRALVRKVDEGENDKIRVSLELPSGERMATAFDMPRSYDEEYDFVRFMRYNGFAMSEVDSLVGSTVEYDVENDRVVYPDVQKSRREKIYGVITTVTADDVWFLMTFLVSLAVGTAIIVVALSDFLGAGILATATSLVLSIILGLLCAFLTMMIIGLFLAILFSPFMDQ